MTMQAIQKGHPTLPENLPHNLYGTRAGIFHLLQYQAAPVALDEEDRVEPPQRQAALLPIRPAKPVPNKHRFREKQRVAKGTSARFAARTSPSSVEKTSKPKAQPVGQTRLSPAAMAVLKGKWTANTATEPTLPRQARPTRPFPVPITNQDVKQLFAEDHFDFQAAS